MKYGKIEKILRGFLSKNINFCFLRQSLSLVLHLRAGHLSTSIFDFIRIPSIRSEIAYALTKEPGLPYAGTARQLGVSHVAISKVMKKENKS